MARPTERLLPLTHHEILGLVRPFVAQGLHVDLEASARHARRLAFKSRQISDAPVIREMLTLDADPRQPSLTRTLTTTTGLVATVRADGTDIGDLVTAVLSVALTELFVEISGTTITEDWTGEVALGRANWQLASTAAHIGPVELRLKVDTVAAGMLDFTLQPRDGHEPPRELPSDFLALLGRDWRRLVKADGIWRSGLRVNRNRARRDDEARGKFRRTVAHLRESFALPPETFHDRHAGARTTVMLRRAIPLAVCILVPILFLAGGWIFATFGFSGHPVLLTIPDLMLVIGMIIAAREVPVIELPPRPRPLPDDAWRVARNTPDPAPSGD